MSNGIKNYDNHMKTDSSYFIYTPDNDELSENYAQSTG